MYKIDTTGLFIGLTTVPHGDQETFPENVIRSQVFNQYKKNLIKQSSNKKASEARSLGHLYDPAFYFLFGSFDLAIISSVDDFALSNRIFHPYSTKHVDKKQDKAIHYDYQMVVGSHPLTETKECLDKKSEDTFLRKKDRYPFIGITTLKLNNFFLAAKGGGFQEAAIKLIKKKLLKQTDDFKFILIETYSWYELTIVCFSDSYETIAENILRLRESCLKQLNDSECDNFILRAPDIEFLRKFTDEDKEVNFREAHIFQTTDTVFGLDYKLFLNLAENKKVRHNCREYKHSDKIKFSTNWELKPGHLKSFIKKFGDLEYVKLTVGDGLLLHPSESSDFDSLMKELSKVNKDNNVHLKRVRTQPFYVGKKGTIAKDAVENKVSDKHPVISTTLIDKFQIPPQSIAELKKSLRQLNISAVLRERILNMYYDYTTGVKDEMLFLFFLELRQFLVVLIENVKAEAAACDHFTSSKQDYQNFYYQMTQYFELAFKNRFHISSQLEHITDYNLDYNGGIQQIISCIDCAYKSIAEIIGEGSDRSNDSPYSFAVATGYPAVDSFQYAVRLNYFHFLQPVFFASVAGHEAANFLNKKYSFKSDEPGSKYEFNEDNINYLINKKNISRQMANKASPDFFVSEKIDIDAYLKEIGYTIRQMDDIHPDYLKMYSDCFDKRKLYNYIIADAVSYYTTFNQNAELIYYWHWCTVLQMPDVYDFKGQFTEEEFIYASFRICMMLKIVGRPEIYKKPDSSCSHLDAYWHLHQSNITRIVDTLFNGTDSSAFSVMQELFMDSIKKESAFMSHGASTEIIAKHKEIEKYINNTVKLINNGEVNFQEFKTGLKYQPIWVLNSLMLLIKNLNGDNRNIFLHRNPENNDPYPYHADSQSNLEHYPRDNSNYVMDPMGGIFTHSSESRQKLFQVTSTFYRYLWHCSLEQKRETINKIFKTV